MSFKRQNIFKILYTLVFSLISLNCAQKPDSKSTRHNTLEQKSGDQNPPIDKPQSPIQNEEDLFKALSALPISPSSETSHKPTPILNAVEAEMEKKFFRLFWRGSYEEIDQLKSEIQSHLVSYPQSIQLLSRLAYANLWQWQERHRRPASSSAPEYVSECVRLFNELFPLAPQNMVFKGFGTNCVMLAATLNQSQAQKDRAYELALTAIKGLREYAPFALSYTFLLAPKDSPRFKTGLGMLFSVLDVCHGQSIDRDRPVTYDKVVPAQFRQSAFHYYCQNTAIAPHNSEGFLFTLADALVKADRLDAARIMYENVKRSKGYATFPYRALVDQRLTQLEQYRDDFNRPFLALENPEHPVISSAGTYSCTICHRASQDDMQRIEPLLEGFIRDKSTLSGALLQD